MIIDTEKIEMLLKDENLTDYQIEKISGVNRVSVKKYRQNGIDAMKLNNAIKLMKGYKKLSKKYSKNYLQYSK
ncbi:hypothetical protein [Ligilactobacillus agilis]|uniref:hypothetical protein n=1 Tax=Ligilactobacillus agilis TaxID=1601 RepID=UPI0022E012EF|nr:hypothetical protein [Ligilactobacillus agilis]